jgi:hypothetical protein
MFTRLICCAFCASLFAASLLACPAFGQAPIEYFDSDAVIDGSQPIDTNSDVIVYSGATVTMIGGNYLTNGPGGDSGVDLNGDTMGGGFVMLGGEIDTVAFNSLDRFAIHDGFIRLAQVGSSVPGNSKILGGHIQELQLVNATYFYGGSVDQITWLDGWLYVFGDNIQIEDNRIVGSLDAGEPIDLNAFGRASIVRSDHILGDADFDGDVDLEDLNLVRNNFGLPFPGDTDLSGTVDLADLNFVRNAFGSSVQAVPEPSTMAAAGMIALVGILARCRYCSFPRRSH